MLPTLLVAAACGTDRAESRRAPADPAARSTPTATSRPSRVALFGDSIGLAVRNDLEQLLYARGIALDSYVRGGTSPCDWTNTFANEVTPDRYRTVFVVFVGNRWTPCVQVNGQFPTPPQIVSQYQRDVTKLIELAATARTPIDFVLPPAIDPARQPEQAALTAELARRVYPDATRNQPYATVVDPAPALGADFTETDRCRPDDGTLCQPDGRVILRTADGIHLCPIDPDALAKLAAECPVPSAGAQRLARLLADNVAP